MGRKPKPGARQKGIGSLGGKSLQGSSMELSPGLWPEHERSTLGVGRRSDLMAPHSAAESIFEVPTRSGGLCQNIDDRLRNLNRSRKIEIGPKSSGSNVGPATDDAQTRRHTGTPLMSPRGTHRLSATLRNAATGEALRWLAPERARSPLGGRQTPRVASVGTARMQLCTASSKGFGAYRSDWRGPSWVNRHVLSFWQL